MSDSDWLSDDWLPVSEPQWWSFTAGFSLGMVIGAAVGAFLCAFLILRGE